MFSSWNRSTKNWLYLQMLVFFFILSFFRTLPRSHIHTYTHIGYRGRDRDKGRDSLSLISFSFIILFKTLSNLFERHKRIIQRQKSENKVNKNQWERQSVSTDTIYIYIEYMKPHPILRLHVFVMPSVWILHSIWEFQISYANAKWLHFVLYFVSKQLNINNKTSRWTIFFRCKNIFEIRQMHREENTFSSMSKMCIYTLKMELFNHEWMNWLVVVVVVVAAEKNVNRISFCRADLFCHLTKIVNKTTSNSST